MGKVTTWTSGTPSIPPSPAPTGVESHDLGQSDGGALVMIEAVHCLEAEDHVQTIGEDEQHEQEVSNPIQIPGRRSLHSR